MKLPTSVTSSIAKAVLQSKKNSPHIFFGVGLGGLATSMYLACKSTLKVEAVLDATQTEIARAKNQGPYESAADEAKSVGMVYAQGGIELIKLYGPAMLIGGVGVAALTGSHIQLTNRNTALMGSLAASMRAFSDYRVRVRDELGNEKELDLFRGLEDATIKNEDGTKEVVKVRTGPNLSNYAKCFDEQSIHWKRNAEMNRAFVTIQEDLANHDLRAKGYVFLNDVYKMLGFPETAAGTQVGWFLNGDGDNYIDFGLHEVRNSDFAIGHERSAWLDFNVDGVIADKLEDY